MKLKLLMIALFVTPMFVMGQKVKVVSGAPGAMASETEFNVEIDFSKAKFYKENMSEQQYIEKRITDITKDKGVDEATKWKEDWELHKSSKMYEKFNHAINKKGKSGVTFAQNSSAKYTVIIQVDWIYPGWFGGAMKQPSKLNTTLTFVETQGRNEVLKLTCVGALGDQYPVGIPNTNNRITQAFDITGVALGKFMKKKFK